jgi:hypothetical protein
MDTTTVADPDASELESLLSTARTQGQVIVIFARCTVQWSGGRDGEIGSGERLIICKPDGAIAVHRPSGARAVARQGIGSSLEVHQLEEGILLYGQKSGGEKSIRIELETIDRCVQTVAEDDAEMEQYQTEDRMHQFIQANPEVIEKDLRLQHHEYPIPQGKIDFVAADSSGNKVIIEVKHPAGKAKHVDQLLRYVKHFRRTEDAAVRGLLVAPVMGIKASRVLRDNDLEGCELKRFDQPDQSPSQTSFQEWM